MKVGSVLVETESFIVHSMAIVLDLGFHRCLVGTLYHCIYSAAGLGTIMPIEFVGYLVRVR